MSKHGLCHKHHPHGPHQFRIQGAEFDTTAEGTVAEWTIDCPGDALARSEAPDPADCVTAEQELRATALVAASHAYAGEAPYEGAQPGFAGEVIGLAETYLQWLTDGTRPAQPDRESSL